MVGVDWESVLCFCKGKRRSPDIVLNILFIAPPPIHPPVHLFTTRPTHSPYKVAHSDRSLARSQHQVAALEAEQSSIVTKLSDAEAALAASKQAYTARGNELQDSKTVESG